MMYLGDLRYVDEDKHSVGMIHYMPFDEENGLGKTEEELLQEGLLIEELPKLENIPNKAPILFCNPQTKEVWYEYVVIPESDDDKKNRELNEIKQQLQDLQIALAEIMGV